MQADGERASQHYNLDSNPARFEIFTAGRSHSMFLLGDTKHFLMAILLYGRIRHTLCDIWHEGHLYKAHFLSVGVHASESPGQHRSTIVWRSGGALPKSCLDEFADTLWQWAILKQFCKA